MFLRTLQIFSILLFLGSCSSDSNKERKPIVLGDSSTIVTETDSAFLSDFVSDIQLQEIPEDTVETPKDSTAVPTGKPDSISTGNVAAPVAKQEGFSIPFEEVTIFIPGIKVKSYRQQDLKRANGVSYQLTDGAIRNNQLQLSGATIQTVSQRYISEVIAKSELGSLVLDGLGTTTSWAPLKGSNNRYEISGLENNDLDAKKVSPAQIRAAVTRAARNKRLSRKELRKWEASVRNVRSLNQKPFVIVLKSVMWKIDGKDAKGKSFSKQVRLDLPRL